MARIAFNAETELKGQGIYPQEGTWFGGPYNPVEKLNTPISPRENLLRYYKGQEFEWYPDIMSDCIDITPYCIPDIDACDYTGGRDSFGVKWIPVENNAALPAFVEPGFKLLDDIADWPELAWPDADSWPWKAYADQYNATYADDNRMRRGVIMIGYFERLISIMTFEEAAVAMASDPESVEAFFDKLTDFNIRVMDHYIDDFSCESIVLHDDWAAQRSPFFSIEMARRVIVPYLKRFCDHAHQRGVTVILHSCGNGTAMVPAMKEAGVDGWQAQVTAINIEEALQACGDDFILELYPEVPDGIYDDELKEYLYQYLKKCCVGHRCLLTFYEFHIGRLKETRRYIYEISRRLALGER